MCAGTIGADSSLRVSGRARCFAIPIVLNSIGRDSTGPRQAQSSAKNGGAAKGVRSNVRNVRAKESVLRPRVFSNPRMSLKERERQRMKDRNRIELIAIINGLVQGFFSFAQRA
jgi:hypothetical protein